MFIIQKDKCASVYWDASRAAAGRKGSWARMPGVPEKQRGMEMRNQSAMREKKAPSGMAPLLPVW